jgi:hypothetical protein
MSFVGLKDKSSNRLWRVTGNPQSKTRTVWRYGRRKFFLEYTWARRYVFSP